MGWPFGACSCGPSGTALIALATSANVASRHCKCDNKSMFTDRLHVAFDGPGSIIFGNKEEGRFGRFVGRVPTRTVAYRLCHLGS
jgi:hypothetical protein